jgi:hypothetical protein
MRKVALALVLLAAAGCGEKKPTTVTVPKAVAAAPPTSKPAEIKSDPNGKYTCITCTLKTNQETCPKCKAPLKVSAAPAPAHAPSGMVGKSQMSAVYACPEAGCTFTDPRKGTCLKHSTVQMKEQWFVCEKDSAKEPIPGKCAKCGAELQKKLF